MIIYTLFFGIFIRPVIDFGNKNDVKFWYVCVISGLVFTAISVLTFVLMKKGKKEGTATMVFKMDSPECEEIAES